MENDHSSIYHLVFFGNLIGNYEKALRDLNKTDLDKIDRDSDYALYTAVFCQTLILTDSLLDEYDKFFTSTDEIQKERISRTKKIVKPAIDRIRRWTDLKNFRNNVLAHNLRIKNQHQVSVFISGKWHKYNIPSSTLDLQILFGCISQITNIISNVHSKEYEQFKNELPEKLDIIIGVQSLEESNHELQWILNEIENRIQGVSKN